MTSATNYNTKRLKRARRIIAAVLTFITLPLILPASISGLTQTPKTSASTKDTTSKPLPSIAPQIPKANRNVKHRVFLEHADKLTRQERDSFMVVTGNVEFSHGAMLMFCDSAHFYPNTESLDAFGNVRMRQGDTLFVYANELNYRGDRQIAFLYGDYGEPVRMINREVTLRTPTFIYDLFNEFGYYNEGGELTDRKNRLISDEGEYIPSTKEANFYNNVTLTSRSESDTLTIYTDTLFYNTNTHIAELVSPSTIINAQATINTTSGTYDTETQIANLFKRSKVVASTGTTLEGDTLYYDRALGFGEAYGNMEINDTTHSVILTGDYGFYNEVVDSAFAMGHALAREYSQGDTLYVHARYFYSYSVKDTIDIPEDTIAGIEASMKIDTTYVMIAHPRVRFYRTDMQGLCDSMRFEQKDSMLYMFHHPVVWSGERQIFGNVIQVHLNDSTVDRATLPDFGFSAEHVEGNFYNQLAGKEMIAYFADGELRRLDVNGNVQAIMLPEEKDSTYNKIVNVESSFLTASFMNQQILRMKMWPETNGTVTPLYLAKKSLYYLPAFKWYTDMRPETPEDVFNIPPQMEALMADIPATTVVPPKRVFEPSPLHFVEEALDSLDVITDVVDSIPIKNSDVIPLTNTSDDENASDEGKNESSDTPQADDASVANVPEDDPIAKEPDVLIFE